MTNATETILQNATEIAKAKAKAKALAEKTAAEAAAKLKAGAADKLKGIVKKGTGTDEKETDADEKGTDAKDAKDAKDKDAKDKDAKDKDAAKTTPGGPGDAANTPTPTPTSTQTPTPRPSVSGSSSAPPSVGSDSGTIKVEFQALYDNAYTEIKQCFCQGMANLFYEAFVPSTEHVYEALTKALYVDVVDKHKGGIASLLNPDYETIVGDQVEKIMKFIMTNPDPQIKIDIRKNLSGGCNISQEHHQASITRGKPTAIVGGSRTYKQHTKHQKIYTQKKSYKKSI
uniref:Uncharacterized protein n=1 Tax=viral metagenome TaxID=1070528 RepID=A0A6C0HVR4_9ZZZZ